MFVSNSRSVGSIVFRAYTAQGRVQLWNRSSVVGIHCGIQDLQESLISPQHYLIQHYHRPSARSPCYSINLSSSKFIYYNPSCQVGKRFLSLSSKRYVEESDDDLKAILKDKSLGLTEKFKIIFRQYGTVMIAVHIATSAVWVALIYYAITRGFDVTPLLERWGFFDYLEKWGFTFVEKLKSSGASDWVVTYAVYELAKPVRYIITLFGTMYAVRYLRRKGWMKRPPKSATMSDLVQTQGKIMSNRLKRTTKKYTDKYKDRLSDASMKKRGNLNRNNPSRKNGNKR